MALQKFTILLEQTIVNRKLQLWFKAQSCMSTISLRTPFANIGASFRKLPLFFQRGRGSLVYLDLMTYVRLSFQMLPGFRKDMGTFKCILRMKGCGKRSELEPNMSLKLARTKDSGTTFCFKAFSPSIPISPSRIPQTKWDD